MRELVILSVAAVLEVVGDALVRWGVHGGNYLGFVLGACVLFAYGLVVNVPKWDFGKLLGVYIAAFFVVAQLVAYFFYHEKIKMPTFVGGTLIVAGGIIMTLWQEIPVADPAEPIIHLEESSK